MADLTDEQARLLEEPNVATVGTVNPDGSPQLTIVWIDWDGEHVLFNTAAGRVKPRNLERDRRVSVLVADRADAYRWVGVRGLAELDRVNVAAGARDTLTRRNGTASLAEATARGQRIRAVADRPTTATISVAFGCPFEGELDPGAVAELAAELDAGELVLADK